MKDEEFKKKLELILERFEKIETEVRKYLSRGYDYLKDPENGSYWKDNQILDNKYKKRK